ncbi:MAG: response regulator [Candidatus Binatia bacterium]
MVRPVLVVDAHEDSRYSLMELLRVSGYVVLGASSGAAALDMLRGGLRPCVILLDLMVPGNGWSFRFEQVSDPELAPIPVIGGSTMQKTQEDVDPAFRVEHCLLKPFDIEALLELVARYCERN